MSYVDEFLRRLSRLTLFYMSVTGTLGYAVIMFKHLISSYIRDGYCAVGYHFGRGQRCDFCFLTLDPTIAYEKNWRWFIPPEEQNNSSVVIALVMGK